MNYNEVKQHGTPDFPFELYKLYDPSHPRYEMAMHWHGSVELVRILTGELIVTLDNRRYVGKGGDVFFINSETAHGALPRDCRYECVVFNLAFMRNGNPICNSFIDEILQKNVFVDEKIESKRAKNLINSIFEYMERSHPGDEMRVFSVVYALLAEIYERRLYSSSVTVLSDKTRRNVLKLKNTISFIRENYAKELTLSDMAAVAGLSTKYFCDFFKQMTDKTPIEYLNMYRVERAARMLLNTDASVTDVAFSSGFNDLSYFIKTFKAYKNCTPSAYRKG